MKRLSFLVSLTNNDNDYQQEQAAAAEKAGRRLGVDVKIIHANNDAVAQSQQLLQYVQTSSARPDAILFEPAGGTAFPQVARAAAGAGIGWVVLNHEVDYILELRRNFKVPVFAISSDHVEVGKIQGEQFGALLPNGGKLDRGERVSHGQFVAALAYFAGKPYRSGRGAGRQYGNGREKSIQRDR